jgi:glycosyltransferase involved in cell wall biosynthesis
MRICLIVPGFSASESDWCIPVLRDLVSWLGGRHRVWLLALRYPYRSDTYSVFDTAVRSLGAGHGTGTRRALMFGRAVAAVVGEHRRAPFDVVHGLWADEAGYLATICGRWIGRPAVVSVMGGELVGLPDIGYGVQLGRTGRILVRRSLRFASVVTIGSAILERSAVSSGGRPRFRRLPLGVDCERFSPDGEIADLAGAPRLLHVASLSPIKDQRTLLRAFARVAGRMPEARLHIVGDGALGSELEDRASRLEVAQRVVFHGAVPHDRLPPLYRAADLHVMSSRFESQGMTALEAAACRTPTVGTAVGILPELTGGVRTVPVGNPEALAAELLSLLESPTELAEMGRVAQALVMRQYTLERCASRLEDLYREVRGLTAATPADRDAGGSRRPEQRRSRSKPQCPTS